MAPTTTVLLLRWSSLVVEGSNLVLLESSHVDTMMNLVAIGTHIQSLEATLANPTTCSLATPNQVRGVSSLLNGCDSWEPVWIRVV